ncbi:hypothetical protein TGRH88_009550 [Toxoplasma gondii]|uniref:Uncharacterized protein n=1 Tax=Toxoplasma gondii TaxID=5811 RepID=A0A7J6KDC4_TOXGO|nr:hypothetical protein TGRH88_009550 [Toxoplasma gondii]
MRAGELVKAADHTQKNQPKCASPLKSQRRSTCFQSPERNSRPPLRIDAFIGQNSDSSNEETEGEGKQEDVRLRCD